MILLLIEKKSGIAKNGSALRSGGNLENRNSDMHFCPTDAKHIVIRRSLVSTYIKKCPVNVLKKWTKKEIKTIIMNLNDVIEVAEKLYYEANPTTRMDVPSYAYEQVEEANKRRLEAKSELSLYDWCKKELAAKGV